MDKQKRLVNNIDMAVERELRSIEKEQNRSRRPGERQKLRKKWEKSAARIEKSGKLSEVWNGKFNKEVDQGTPHEIGYFGGVNFDNNGQIIK